MIELNLPGASVLGLQPFFPPTNPGLHLQYAKCWTTKHTALSPQLSVKVQGLTQTPFIQASSGLHVELLEHVVAPAVK